MINISQYDKSTTATRFTSGCNTGHLEIIQCNDWVTVQKKIKNPSTEKNNGGSWGAGNCTMRLLSPKSACQIIQIHIIQVDPLLLEPVFLLIHLD